MAGCVLMCANVSLDVYRRSSRRIPTYFWWINFPVGVWLRFVVFLVINIRAKIIEFSLG